MKKLDINPNYVEYGGIVAHNTSGILMRAGASSLQLSSSAASTTADIQLAAADRIDLFASSFSLSTSSPSAGDIKIDSAGTFTLSTSRNNANILLLPGTGNVGIGTTGPSYTLHVSKSVAGDQLAQFRNSSATGHGISIWNGLDTNPSFKIVNAAGTADNIVFYGDGKTTIAGNVGIGTTGPSQKLHVEGSCVTGDTMLPIRRRKRRKSNGLESNDDDSLFDFFLCRIDEIQPGDEVLSLNELSGLMEYARINKLMDMDVRDIYELTTKSGKVIRTTANHPYLTLLKNNPITSTEKINI